MLNAELKDKGIFAGIVQVMGVMGTPEYFPAAEQFGLGACWIHIRNRAGQRTTADEEIRKLLGVPDKYSVLNVVAFGQKGEKKSARTEKIISRCI